MQSRVEPEDADREQGPGVRAAAKGTWLQGLQPGLPADGVQIQRMWLVLTKATAGSEGTQGSRDA